MICSNPECEAEVPNEVRNCVVCGRDVGCPNVRAARRVEEGKALDERIKLVSGAAKLNGSEASLQEFREVAASSVAVICRNLGQFNQLISSDNELVATFYGSVSSEARLPENNEWDQSRSSVDEIIFPYYKNHIRFAALSLDGRGVMGYGGYCAVLKDPMIRDRASVFEENTILFVKRHRIVPGDPVPFGYRAPWERRDALALAKVGHKLLPTTTSDQFPALLMPSEATDSDFIEVHIYGPLHRRAIKEFSGPKPRHKADQTILRSIHRKLDEVGASVRVS